MEEYSTGIPINNGMIMDAITYQSGNTEYYENEDFIDGEGIAWYGEADTTVMEISFNPGELSGLHRIDIYGCDVDGWAEASCYFKISAGDVVKYTSADFGFGTMFHKSFVKSFDATDPYTLEVITSTDTATGGRGGALDFIQLQRLEEEAVRTGENFSGYPTIMDSGSVNITGNNTAYNTVSISFNDTFISAPRVFVNCSTSSLLNCHAHTITITGCDVAARTVDNSDWLDSVTHTFEWMAIGQKYDPYLIRSP